MFIDIDSADIRLITEIANTQSLTKGADKCHMSAPAASARIKKLENNLGKQLFNRTPQGLTPTSAGLIAIKHANMIRDQIQSLINEVQADSSEIAGLVRLFANSLSLHVYVPPILEKFLLRFPSVNIDLQEKTSTEICKQLKQGACDVGLISADADSRGLVTYPYQVERLVLVTHPDHAVNQNNSIEFSSSLDYDFVALSDSSALQLFINRMIEKNHFKLKTRIQVQTFESLCGLVETGVGIGLIPYSVAAKHAKNRNLSIIRLKDSWSTRELSIAVQDPESLSPAAKTLFNALKANHLQIDRYQIDSTPPI